MKRELAGSLVFDASAVLDLLYSTRGGVKIREALKNEKVSASITEVNLVEVMYVLCRRLGSKEAEKRVEALLESRYLDVHPASGLLRASAEYKCARKISLADCFAIALAKEVGVPVLFSAKENDLIVEMSKEPFDVDILFLEDLA